MKKNLTSHLHIHSLLLLIFLISLVAGSAVFVIYTVNASSVKPAAFLPGICILCALYLAVIFLYIRIIYLPARRLHRSVQQLAEGNFDTIFPETGFTELSDISHEFNELTASIRQIINNEYNIKLSKKHAELNALQSQINPHFLYNTIDSIRGKAIQDGSHDIADIAKALASIFRYCIDTPDTNLVTLQEELQHVNNYFFIQQYRFRDRFTLTIDVEEHPSDLRRCYLPRLTLQPLVENALGHGLEHKTGRGSVRIKVRASQSRLLLYIEDDGAGIPAPYLAEINEALLSAKRRLPGPSSPGSGSRFALLNVNERIRIIFGGAYGVRMYSTYGVGTQCEIVLPLLTENPERKRTK